MKTKYVTVKVSYDTEETWNITLQEVKEIFQMMNNLKRHAIIIDIEQGVNQSEIITNVITKVGDYFGVSKVEMGAPVNMGNLRRQIMEQPGVINIVDIKVFNKVGNGYSSSEISQAYVDPETKQIALIDETIFLQPNEIAAIRVPQVDINVRFKQPSQPIIY